MAGFYWQIGLPVTTPEPSTKFDAPHPPPADSLRPDGTLEKRFDLHRNEGERGPYTYDEFLKYYANSAKAVWYWSVGDPVTTPEAPAQAPVPAPVLVEAFAEAGMDGR